MLNSIVKELQFLKNKEKSQTLSSFFKTRKGEYGDGDVFLGIVVPLQRKVARKYTSLELSELQTLLSSKIHEFRLTSLFILIDKYKKAKEKEKRDIIRFYLRNTKNINNWDLVDLSAPNILGDYLKDKNKSVLYKLANSSHLWEKRIAILSTFAFIRNNMFEDALNISKILIKDNHDLIHKAVGWMLREIGKRDIKTEENFLKEHCRKMPRTMLRYAIEKFPEQKRKRYLAAK
jgi:3-methyladenine DNA glycosylase AlkD